MSLLPFVQPLLGQNSLYGCTVGVSDLPTSTVQLPQVKVGDYALNLSGTGPSMWRAVTVTSTTITWAEQDSATSIQTVSAAVTASTTNGIIFQQLASGTVTLPAPSLWPIGQKVAVKNVSGGSLTVVPASTSIDTAAAYTIAAQAHVSFSTDGVAWWSV